MKKRRKVERIKKPKNMEQFTLWLYQNGYEEKNGKPIRCLNCRCRKLKEVDHFYDDFWGSSVVAEFSVQCKSCGSIVGHWAYGNWEI